MKKCIICQNWIPDDAKRCETCGFTARRWFLSKHHYASWMEQTVIPYRKQWETREEEKQRKEEIQPSETENEQTAEKTAEIPAAVSKPKKKLCGLMAAGAAVVILAVGIVIGVGFDGKQDSDVENIEPKQTETTQSTQVENTASSSQTDEEEDTVPDFDLNLFENIPLTTRDEMVSWLDENGYSYEERGEPETDGWRILIRVSKGTVAVKYLKATIGYQDRYQMVYKSTEENIKSYLHQDFAEKYNLDKISNYYYDEKATYFAEDSTDKKTVVAKKTVYLDTDLKEILEQIDEVMPLITGLPDPTSEKKTESWLEENGFSFENEGKYLLENWHTYYYNKEGWCIYYKAGNYLDYYQLLQRQLEQDGYKVKEEADNEYGKEITYTKEEKAEICIEYHAGLHALRIWVG